ncbi:Probable RNA-directed DNA polymerase from transposon BS [Eumeta japonica]|uniref:Probable RNA-directed DNA polymerase from transposon BS n=1 Tax=Eumeta variegata TaxID=151549 RepID=A0A4C1U5A2_EUMVA|nr:Probable RNA-directed DNA polymerase from transposon BS [Eumeta japonica]
MKLLLLLSLVYASDAYKILVVFPTPGKSHSILGHGFVDTLSQAGHEITYITAFPIDRPPANIRQIDISSILDNMPHDMIKIPELIKNPLKIHIMAFMGPGFALGVLEHENVQKFLADTTQEFDVVIVEWFFTNVFSGSVDPHREVLELIDEPSNPAYTSSILTTVIPPFDFFDRVNELFMQPYIQFLGTKLHHYGVTGRSLGLLKSYLSDRVQRVDINDERSPGSLVNMGVPQGSVLGPFLFLVYISDLPHLVKNRHGNLLFADDTSLLFKIDRHQSAFDKVNSTIFEIFVMVKDEVLDIVDTTLFLGLTLDSKLRWNSHITRLAKRLGSAAYAIKRIRLLTVESTARLVYFSLVL